MSSLGKLSIQGIRSFGPEENRVMEFYSPLSLILGQNGCGKTTIIESLKFITTGEVPPGCGRGAPFVHDPKIARESCVRGQIKLRFKSVKGDVITASRSVEVVQKPKKLEFSSLDSTLQYKAADGKTNTVSNKCIDFHLEVASLLGVAKPILENVIFCHQEESNWPLDEGKKVKEKFDAIFNATKYIKCIDNIRKLRKEKTQAVKNMLEILDTLKVTKEQATRFKTDLEEVKRNRVSLTEQQEKLNADRAPIQRRVKEIVQAEHKIATIDGDIRGKKHQLQSIQDMQQEIQSKQSEKFECSDDELHDLIRAFDQNMKHQEVTQRNVELDLKNVSQKIESLKKEESKAYLYMGKLEAAQKTHKDNVQKRDTLLEQIIRKYDITGYEGNSTFTMTESVEILRRVDESLQKEKEKLQKGKKEFEEKETTTQREMDSLRSEEATLEHDITTLSRQVDENSKRGRTLRQKLAANEEELASTSIEDLQNSVDEIVRAIEQEEERVSVPKLSKDIKSKKEEKEKHEKELEELKKKIAKLNRLAQSRSQYDIYVKEKSILEQKNTYLKRKNADDFQNIFSGPVGDNVRNELDAQLNNLRRQMNNARENKSILEKKKTELGMKLENEKREMQKLERETKDFQSKLEDICSGNDLEFALERSKEQLELLNKRKGDYESSKVMFRGFMEKIRSGEGCPLCHRDFDEGYQKDLLVDEIESKLSRLPHELTQVKKDLQMKESLREKLLQLRPQKESSDKAVKEHENRGLHLKSLQKDLEKVNSDLDESSTGLAFLMSEEEACNRVQSDVVVLDNNLKSIRQLNDKISTIQATLGTSDGDLSMDELMKLQTDGDTKVKNLRDDVEALQEKIMEHNRHMQILKDQKIQLSTRQLELKTKQQETEKMNEEVEKLKSEKEKMEERIESNRIAIAPIKFQLKEKAETKRKVSLEKDAFVDQENRKIQLIRDEVRGTSDIQRSISKYIDDGCDTALVDGRKKLEALQEETKLNDAQKNHLQSEANRILKNITTQKERKRNMTDEQTVRQKEKEAKELESAIASLKDQMKMSDYDKLIAEKNKLIREDAKLNTNFANLDGRLDELAKKQKDLEYQLNVKGIKNAEKNYKEKLIKMKCMEVAGNDLNKYFKALETSIMNFHQVKMNSINSIIRELWRTTYKGNDIDHIEIKTDETESQGADKRRTYNYRVVMVKNEVEMDMRARCSAGQKVLASLIIRMALAETFSSNCAILALDEPTTNLDKENIEALSLALLNIVNRRYQQKNFQLIVITHDSEFLERMTRADFIEHYHKVDRNENGLSVITKHSAL